MKIDINKSLNFIKLNCSYINYPSSSNQAGNRFFDHRENIIKNNKLKEFNIIHTGYKFIREYDELINRFNKENKINNTYQLVDERKISATATADREALLRSKEFVGLNKKEKKVKFNKIIDDTLQVLGDMSDETDKAILKDKERHIKSLNEFNFKKDKLFKTILLKLNANKSLSHESQKILEKNKKDLTDYLIDLLRKKEIIRERNFINLAIYLNAKWFENLEISYLLRKTLDLVDSELVILCIGYSDLNALEYTEWDEIEVCNHPFYRKYRKVLTHYRKYFKSDKAKKEGCNLSYKKIAILRNIDQLRLYKKNLTPLTLKSDFKDYYLAKNSKEHFKMMEENEEIYKKRCQKLSVLEEEVLNQFGILTKTKKWKNENILFENVNNILKPLKIDVSREYSIRKLKQQRLDIYFEINNKKYGLEYQGEQHYRPIDFFGGKKAFIKRKKLDSLKKRRCKKAKINLIEFKYSEPINLLAIINKLKQNGIKVKGGNYAQNI
jgi:hypothetical protein